MNHQNPAVDFYFEKADKWQKEFLALRSIALDCSLTEELKWGQACYMHDNVNIVLIHGFKEYCAFLFFKGALMKDPEKLLVQQTKNVQSARQIRFTDVKDIVKKKAILKAYIYEAIEIEKAGLKVAFKKPQEFVMSDEFKSKISGKSGAKLKAAFEALTPGRQRTYLLYFSSAKQAKTREERVAKCIDMIMDGKGLND